MQRFALEGRKEGEKERTRKGEGDLLLLCAVNCSIFSAHTKIFAHIEM